MKGKAFENPLLSHARMRGLYRGLVEVRGLKLVPRLNEACYVAPCIGVDEGDYVFATSGLKAAEYLRSLGAREGGGAPRVAEVRRVRGKADQPFAGNAADGLLCAGGAAMALRAAGGQAIALALVGGKGASEASLERALRASGAADLPLVVVALPDSSGPDWTAAGRKAGVPVIPVDAADAVALYRVAQEAIIRARADRRGAVIECVAGVADPVKMMAAQLIAKRIATERWAGAVESGFRQLLTEG